MLGLLGAEPADTVDDLFPGSGAVGHAIELWRQHPVLPSWERSEINRNKKYGRKARAREIRMLGYPTLESFEIADRTADAAPQDQL